eukprot:526382_1
MGNSSQKQKKKENLEIFKTLNKNVMTSEGWNDTIQIVISYWARNSCLNSIAFQHVTSIMIISAIQAFAKHHFAAQIAKKILSFHKLNGTEFSQYTQEKFESLQTFISKEHILRLCEEIEPILAKDDILFKLNLKPDSDQKLIIFGDIRGDLLSLLKHFDSIRNNDNICKYENIIDKIYKYNDIYLFLGSYVSRGKFSIECIVLIYCLKLIFPNNIYLLRGFQECASINRIYGFYDELKKCYPKISDEKSRAVGIYMWKRINETFKWMPFAAVINNRWFAVHSGISPTLKQLDMYHMLCIDKYNRPVDIGDSGLFCDLVWCDPEHIVGWGTHGGRSVSYTFGPDVLDKFLKKNNLDMIVRAHQVVENGFEWFVENKLVTLFSTADYCGEFDNDGAIMIVDSDLKFEFSVAKSMNKEHKIV